MRTIVAIVAVLFAGGCTLEDGAAPPLSGPSEFGLSVTLSATPDQLPRDGSSQSVITITVRDASSRPVAGQRLSVSSTGGTLSEADVVTNSGGQAILALTSPPPGTVGAGVAIQVIPFGSDARNDAPRTLVIGFTGAPNLRAPVPDFQTTPAEDKIEVNQSVRFDASKTKDEDDAPCLNLCTYHWDFGDGTTKVGRIVDHMFTVAKAYSVTLKVIDAAGTDASVIRVITVKTVPAPTFTGITVSPETAIVNQQVVFTANAKAADGHSIQRYEWNFGDKNTQTTSGPTVAHTYDKLGTYVVTVTAIDDLGQTGVAAKSVVVDYGIDKPVANFTVLPSSPAVGVQVTFDGSTSTVGFGAKIVRYLWDPGDGQSPIDSGEVPIQVGKYNSPGTYTVTLTITDSLGRQATKTVSITVVAP